MWYNVNIARVYLSIRDLEMKRLIFIFIYLLIAATCQARTITVDDDGPADFNNIQAAINDSNDGDVIEVQPSTYTRSLSE